MFWRASIKKKNMRPIHKPHAVARCELKFAVVLFYFICNPNTKYREKKNETSKDLNKQTKLSHFTCYSTAVRIAFE